ncbi:MAG TPA: hypothetical protein VFR58_17335 [Flavisolibacter sp.]|nr:hypothetical protein [Flavisolibacter sp.]
MRRDNQGEKRRRRIITKGPVLVRSVKPGQVSAASYQKESTSNTGIWKN